jgi:glycosyltransferase involved in cell wall biosynthesis
MLAVGARAATRARAKGRSVKLVWDAHEYAPGLVPRANPRWLPAITAHEAEFVPYADAVVTVSPSLARLLQKEHELASLPNVVMNAPVQAPAVDESAAPVPDLRHDCGVGPDVPLLAYVGGITPVRGVDIIVDALPQLPDVHVAVVSMNPSGKNSPCDKLYARAQELGVADRVHLLPYVPHWQVSEYLSSADAAVSPLHHLPNHEIALSNKFFEYSHARLPLLTSDIRTMAEMVRETGQGEVFRAQDLDDFVRQVRAVLADPQKYRDAYDRDGLLASWTWEAQATVLDRVYGSLLPGRSAAASAPAEAQPVPEATLESLGATGGAA